ncbi:hypothetical protein A2331_05865 [Candidatus Falkowbacteria bacterium RIFOXYB2_FULL_34_18]|uniref:Uncharacterized protein n=1 Tax=Candidatus Falkowbacteria bacterium RIFOXYD2_FULL_34_120 TaxID=1798007 RepID=A0A1F5TM83_9BACT|nr:MAG: hypothetical protein A2331_05865 [Candidatus Falkowbacteria bacterium RIFOXYB2_FULL_34_18]OGF29171.1 MAG: hypothetical protein A2500_05810 [Candidatus Falkowbacteria bacterium RIFOXYC12_FULL_34_55]OGF36977.1 MAG: hypothetical protein A2466_07190 [Candidatus Falkowbacteria bacterium RIFOXYC2_FULL_34_220]OGF38693.1 MAG: hypothetical protein A2515_01475 [Candidatus Falkowbacteria bacterium RIFOXYD12_FULL_34_57]OGF39927.1 MAG: hypothetical protein A2531_01730 [Candidatus Falkowbacteria bact
MKYETKNNIKLDNDTQNCWEFFCCDKRAKKECPAFQNNSGRECWIIASTFQSENKKKFKYCWNCPWFKKLNLKF